MKSLRSILVPLAVVAAATLLAGCGSKSTPTGVEPALDTAPPPAPVTLVVQRDDQTGRDFLTWTPSSAPDLAGYQIFQYLPDPSRDNSYAMVAETGVNQPMYLLPVVGSDTKMFFRLRSVDTSGNHSGFTPVFAAHLTPFEAGPGGETTPGGGHTRDGG